MARHLIVLGFAKCGTSLLYEVLKKCPEFHAPVHKETNFFSMEWGKGLDHYYSKYQNYQNAESENKIFVDSSPTYLGKKYLTVLERIKSSLGKDTKFVICLRNPIYRAFSHYKHQINAHYSRYGFFARRQKEDFSKIYDRSFYDEEEINNEQIFEHYIDKVRAVENILGKQNILYFILENDTKNFDGFYRKLCNHLKIDYQPHFKNKALPKVLVGDYMSHYLCSMDKDLIVPYKNKLYSIDKGTLLLVNHRANELFRGLDEEKVMRCLSASYRWNSFLNSEVAKQMFDKFFVDDCSQLENLLRLDFSSWTVFKDKLSPKTEFKPHYVESGLLKEAKKITF